MLNKGVSRVFLFVFMIGVPVVMSSCNKHKILRAETVELQRKLATEEQVLRQAQAQLLSLGSLGRYDKATEVELAAAKGEVERLVKDKESTQTELDKEIAKLEELKSRLAKYQTEQFKHKNQR